MSLDRSRMWRLFFVIGGMLYLAGSFQHPHEGGMAAMLADPAWVPGHATIFVGLLVLVVGLVLFRRSRPASASMERWLRLAILATSLEALEMGVHTMAYLDANAMVAGQSTPVLTTHLWLATLIYPFFGAAFFGLIWVGQRERSLGSVWISWIGMFGAVAHGAVMWLVFIFEIAWAGVLFPLAALSVSLWFILAGLWPVRSLALSGTPTNTVVDSA